MSNQLSRRALFHSLACGCATLPVGLIARPANAAKTDLTADQALAQLKEGNAAFVKGGACVPTGGPARVAELAKGQGPFAVVVGCSDSRTPPEHLFGRGLGELFVVRVAGNTVDPGALGSIEYAVAVLGAPLILVLGHSKCGAVEAAAKVVTENAAFRARSATWCYRSCRRCCVHRRREAIWSRRRSAKMWLAWSNSSRGRKPSCANQSAPERSRWPAASTTWRAAP
jgi:carbonic anhydrase